ncbi:MAG: prolipoprotein diacylglyceryl transferase [Candidatus Izemoplasmatales bacterium]|jgi:phosphatidylglycerol:prolipoprotein diacylglycerol transferase|nr:prolipoprotein diacylglyceryl transferase [bacterium]MDZ4196742.1 prolipoprotein diacylglyceryl transferase [Candidatus Izemoplasmatales bacterium]
MKSIKLWMTFLLIVIASFAVLSCASVPTTNPDNTFTVVFVDHDNTVLKTITCDVAEPCDIVPPANPNNKENTYFTRWSVFESDFDEIQSNTTIKAIYTLDNRVVVIGNRAILFYSFFIMLGIIAALFLGLKEAKRLNVNQDALIDGFLWIVPVAILGARLWYVAFELEQFVYGGFFPSVLRVLGFSSGTLDFSTFGLSGLAIHGAFFTAIVCAYFFTKKRKIDLLRVIDFIAIGFIIAQAFGRWGNFFNQEAHGPLVGGLTNNLANLSLKEQFEFLRYSVGLPEFVVNNMYIQAGFHSFATEPLTGFYHPTFFYEMFFNLIGFGIMLVLRRIPHIKFGEIFGFYLIWYGLNRIFIEILRTDPLTFVFLGITFRSAIVTSVLMILGGIALSLYIRLKLKGEGYDSVPGHFTCPRKKISS